MDLTQEQWAAQLADDPNAVVLDVRTAEEWNDGVIPNARLIDIYKPQDFMDQVNALDKDANYYVYCKAGGRSAQACAVMNKVGILNTYNLVGGFSNWKGPVSAPN